MKSKRMLFFTPLIGVTILLLSASAGTVQADPVLTPQEALGQSIFFDVNLSINQNQACATCHGPQVGWTGSGEVINEHGAVYEGSIPGRFGDRKPPSIAYATQSPVFFRDKKGDFVGGNFWDGRATGAKLGNPAADQAQGPFLNPKEQALPDSACVVYRVCNPVAAEDYPVAFEDIWGTDACAIAWPADVESTCATESATVALSDTDRVKSAQAYDNIALSIAAYEASPEVNAFTSKFDYAGKGQAKLTKEEQKGFALFQGKGNCVRCHVSNGHEPLFTDYTFDNLGIPKNPENPAGTAPAFVDPGLGGFLQWTDYPEEIYSAAWGKFKVPTLRNVDLRPSPDFVKAYGHNGYFKSLDAIVHFYNTRDVLPTCETVSDPQPGVTCWPAPEVAVNINTADLGNLGLTAEEEAAIVAFLKTLSDGYVPNMVNSADIASESVRQDKQIFLPIIHAD